MSDLSALFHPQSLAVIGASSSPEKVGAIVLRNIISSGFSGKIYPINPKESVIQNHTCFPDVAHLPEIPDLAIIAVPASIAIEILPSIAERGIKNLVIFSAGFKEIGAEGANLEHRLLTIAHEHKLNLLGPNCLGFANTTTPLNATFGRVVNIPGNLRIITQSGAIAASLMDWCQVTGLGYSDFISIGNKSVLGENEILSYWLSSSVDSSGTASLSSVSPIGLYLESIENGTELVALAQKLSRTSPIFALKPGRTSASASAMRSHTGAIAGSDAVLDQAFRESGIIRCHELGEFFDLARGFSWEDAPLGPRVAVISNAGGPAVLASDTIVDAGLEMAQFSDETKKTLSQNLPRMANFSNPVDVLGDALADRFSSALTTVITEPTVDSIVVILTPQLMTQIEKTAEVISSVPNPNRKPILCSFIGGGTTLTGEEILNQHHIPSYPFPERAIRTLASMWQWRQYSLRQESVFVPGSFANTTKVNTILSDAKKASQKALDSFQSSEIMSLADIPTPPAKIITSIQEAEEFVRDNHFPVVLKISSSEVLHKTEVGGVITKITDINKLHASFDLLQQKIANLKINPDQIQILIQTELPRYAEVIVGVKRDPDFGPVMLFGAGGQLAELIADRNLALLPITPDNAKEFIKKSKIYPLLSGFRGRRPLNVNALFTTMAKLSELVIACPDISEIEINPLVMTLTGVSAVDPKIILSHNDAMPVIDKPTSSPLPSGTTAITLAHDNLATKYHHFVFKTENPLVYKPGQFITVKVADKLFRAYSIAGSKSPNEFELLVDVSPGGPGSQYFEKLSIGDNISFIGPSGKFILHPEIESEESIFIGTGSGIAPLKCMIEDLLTKQKYNKPVTLYFGLRFKEDLFWYNYFTDLEKTYPNFHFKLTLSKPCDGWSGFCGHVTEMVRLDFHDASHATAYLCGNRAMTEESISILKNAGCPDKQIFFEHYN